MNAVFNSDLVYQVVRTKMLNKRRRIASTKDRAQVSGGGKKHWPQKGTGRARAGSNRSPIWKGGGITFGPNAKRIYAGKVTQTMSRLALDMVLAKKKEAKQVITCDTIDVKEPKTKQFQAWLRPLVVKGTCLVVGHDRLAPLKRAGKNIPGVMVKGHAQLDVIDLLTYEYLVITEQALAALEKRLTRDKK